MPDYKIEALKIINEAAYQLEQLSHKAGGGDEYTPIWQAATDCHIISCHLAGVDPDPEWLIRI